MVYQYRCFLLRFSLASITIDIPISINDDDDDDDMDNAMINDESNRCAHNNRRSPCELG